MAQLDSIALSQAVKQRLVDFFLDDNFVRDTELSRICRELWSGPPARGGIVSDLWVEGAFPAMRSDQTLNTLAAQGRFDSALRDQLHRRGAVPRDRQLYTHQVASILEAQEEIRDMLGPHLTDFAMRQRPYSGHHPSGWRSCFLW